MNLNDSFKCITPSVTKIGCLRGVTRCFFLFFFFLFLLLLIAVGFFQNGESQGIASFSRDFRIQRMPWSTTARFKVWPVFGTNPYSLHWLIPRVLCGKGQRQSSPDPDAQKASSVRRDGLHTLAPHLDKTNDICGVLAFWYPQRMFQYSWVIERGLLRRCGSLH